MTDDFGTVVVHAQNEIAETSACSQTSVAEEPQALSHVESTSFISKCSELTNPRCLLLFLSLFPQLSKFATPFWFSFYICCLLFSEFPEFSHLSVVPVILQIIHIVLC